MNGVYQGKTIMRVQARKVKFGQSINIEVICVLKRDTFAHFTRVCIHFCR